MKTFLTCVWQIAVFPIVAMIVTAVNFVETKEQRQKQAQHAKIKAKYTPF